MIKYVILLFLFSCATNKNVEFCQSYADRFDMDQYGVINHKNGSKSCYLNHPGGNGTIITIDPKEAK